MLNPSRIEEDARNHASDQAGKYLESLGKTDFATMTVTEWLMLINVICWEYDQRKLDLSREEGSAASLPGAV